MSHMHLVFVYLTSHGDIIIDDEFVIWEIYESKKYCYIL